MTQPARLDLLETDAPAILGGPAPDPDAPEPSCFRDLNLDQVVAAIVAGRDEYDLVPLFRTALREVADVEHRHEVFRDLERGTLRADVEAFAEAMRETRRFLHLTRAQHFKQEVERWFLDAAEVYCAAVRTLAAALDAADLRSDGFLGLRDYLAAYTRSAGFVTLAADRERVREGLDRVRYTVRIKGARVTVGLFADEPDYSAEVERTFERFRRGAVETRLAMAGDPGSMSHVEAWIAERVALLHPAAFRALDAFCKEHAGFVDAGLARFDREVQFYLAYLDHMDALAGTGAVFSYPSVGGRGEILAEDACDLALAGKLAHTGKRVVRNGFSLRPPERILVVTGPNQGGKTTFARAFGQLHQLAALGVPVPARRASLVLPDRVLTHFERQEDISTLRGKLDDELVRMREILEHATAGSVLVVNEIFASTTLEDAVQLGTNVLRRVIDLGCAAVFVTFVDELTTVGPETVSMVAAVDPRDPAVRTFEILRRPSDGRAYALAIAEKYGLSQASLARRLEP